MNILMAFNTFKCNHLIPLHFEVLTNSNIDICQYVTCGKNCFQQRF